ncbi:hypothetical protein B0T16DRAFT_462816 [Cercophora newfieldiana]|uniref:Zn(2)-C6 fungal-type domain-containing protein n=1 Tax=Cercophora newfieldiana TaxID=92897 RepID=A0AA40CHK2_9PEZI|nr:hypothetical protein B0T16DRAFT_462816 [Cercophora newfieldiana]
MSLPIAGQHFAPIDVDEAEMSGMSGASGMSADKRPAEEPAADAPLPRREGTESPEAATAAGLSSCGTTKKEECTNVLPDRKGGRRFTPPPPPPDADEYENIRYTIVDRPKRDKVPRFRCWENIACDACRVLKIERCSGKTPCEPCFEKRIPCTYKYIPETLLDPSVFEPREPGPLNPELENLQPARRYANEETPPLVFLHKAWRQIADPLRPASMRPSDQPFDRSSPFRLPPESRWPELLGEFFGGFSGVFQILHRPSLQQWADTVQRNDRCGYDLWHGLTRSKAAIVLMALALGSFFRDRAHRDKKANKPDEWIWSLNFGDSLFATAIAYTDAETGYPTLESAQVRLLEDIYLLCTSRFLQAWNTFGNTLQTISALGYHRRIGRNRGLSLNVSVQPNYAKLQCERRLFCTFNDDTINRDLPDAIIDEDCDENGPISSLPSDCYIEALVHHAKLNKILERIYSEVYTLRDIPEEDRLKCAARLADDVESWQKKLPYLMQQRETSLLPVFRRQSIILRLAYYHAQMLVYRPFLMAPYPHWGDNKRIADHAVKELLETCRLVSVYFFDLARNLEPRMFGTIWYAHQVGYCASAIIYFTPHFRERQQLFGGPNYRGYEGTDEKRKELADRMTEILANTNPYSPGPRFSTILKELRAEAEHLSGHVTWNPQHPTQGAAPGGPKRLWDSFKIVDWNDLDSAAFGPISDFAPVPIVAARRR